MSPRSLPFPSPGGSPFLFYPPFPHFLLVPMLCPGLCHTDPVVAPARVRAYLFFYLVIFCSDFSSASHKPKISPLWPHATMLGCAVAPTAIGTRWNSFAFRFFLSSCPLYFFVPFPEKSVLFFQSLPPYLFLPRPPLFALQGSPLRVVTFQLSAVLSCVLVPTADFSSLVSTHALRRFFKPPHTRGFPVESSFSPLCLLTPLLALPLSHPGVRSLENLVATPRRSSLFWPSVESGW